jgi:hypothetical protein
MFASAAGPEFEKWKWKETEINNQELKYVVYLSRGIPTVVNSDQNFISTFRFTLFHGEFVLF